MNGNPHLVQCVTPASTSLRTRFHRSVARGFPRVVGILPEMLSHPGNSATPVTLSQNAVSGNGPTPR
jgi:hypothetical protein